MGRILVSLMAVGALCATWLLLSPARQPPAQSGDPVESTLKPPQPGDPAIEAYCGRCHAFPRPDDFTMATWRPAIDYMYGLLDEAPRAADAVEKSKVLAYYADRAASQVTPPTVPPPWPGPSLARYPTTLGDGPHVVSRIRDAGGGLAALDMLSGRVYPIGPGGRPQGVITRVANPVDVHPADLDADGHRDLLIADLGTFNARDNARGGVHWLRGTPNGTLTATDLGLPQMGRVAALATGDVDEDGTADLVVAEFGWQKTGSLRLFWRNGEHPPTLLDPRPGHVAVDMADMDGDGDLDIVATVAQAHESVVVYENQGDRRFRPRTVFEAPSPLWGSIGQRVVDLDADGDLDILHFNGDALDAPKLAAFQGVHLLENRGEGQFAHRHLATLPGTHDIDVGDLDGDGDLDIVAVANLPPHIESTLQHPTAQWRPARLVIVRQSSDARFEAFTVEHGAPCYSSVRILPGKGPRLLVGAFGYGWQVLGHDLTRHHAGCDPNVDLVLYAPRGANAALPRPHSAGRLVETAAAYRQILRTDPEHGETYLNLGQVLSELGRRSEAVTALERAAELSPDSPYPHNNLATAYDLMGDPQKARHHAEQAVALDPDYADGYNTLAIVRHRSGDLEGALDALSTASRLDPKSAVYPFNRGRMLAHAGRLEEAENALLSALEKDPRHPEAARALSTVRRGLSSR